ncbi:hypothetical protein AAFF_G00049460 [Aldrovandia affinis]|uniref:Uncharacterized protein n=1 Tax=Aldrovandia affinis TaxID=143900 RepID=A0AAD7S185_9TELE|nr:hypothetical protein AAFF_G00049460 [Aldrovandia affinis]
MRENDGVAQDRAVVMEMGLFAAASRTVTLGKSARPRRDGRLWDAPVTERRSAPAGYITRAGLPYLSNERTATALASPRPSTSPVKPPCCRFVPVVIFTAA